MEKLQEYGWYLTERGQELISDHGNLSDMQKIIKRAAELDLKEISSGEGDINEGKVILQIQKLRNISAPKSNEESRSAPRMLKLTLTDGKTSYQAVEVENISSISLNTPPGTKLLLQGPLTTVHGIILLKPANIGQILVGKVANLVEKWELNKKLALHTRVRSVEEGGPPPWIPFGKKIVKILEHGKNFKALAEKDKVNKENTEFEAQRKDAIAEAAKQGSKKIFGGGNVQLLDHSVQKIVDQGFTIEQAEHALKTSRNNVEKALRSLQRSENKSSREPREAKGKRNEKKTEEVSAKPTSGKISLFDFLEDKLPPQLDVPESQMPEYHVKERQDSSRGPKSNKSQNKSPRNPKNSRGYQVPPRHADDNRSTKNSNSNSYGSSNPGVTQHQYGQYDRNNTSQQKTRPPRFQRNQENQNFYQQESMGPYNKFPQVSEFRNSVPQQYTQPQPNQEFVSYQDYVYNSYQNQDSVINSRNHNSTLAEAENRNRQYNSYQMPKRDQQVNPFQQQPNQVMPNRFYMDENQDLRKFNSNVKKNNSSFPSTNNDHQLVASNQRPWQVGDKCMAKYWEDNMYYTAEVTAVSETTCVVRYQEFFNYEEVLQTDCMPMTEKNKRFVQDNRKDHRSGNKPPRFEQNQSINFAGESRRGGSSGNKGQNRRRPQQRGAQPIYQPPAQRANNLYES